MGPASLKKRKICLTVVPLDMENASASQIEKLADRENYATWKFAMRVYLESEDLWGCVEETIEYTTDTKKMTKARARIILRVEKQNYSHLQDTTTREKRGKS